MKFAIVCSLFVVFVVSVCNVNGQPARSPLDFLGNPLAANNDAAGFAPGHEGHIHSSSNNKAGCGGRTSTTTVATTAAG